MNQHLRITQASEIECDNSQVIYRLLFHREISVFYTYLYNNKSSLSQRNVFLHVLGFPIASDACVFCCP